MEHRSTKGFLMVEAALILPIFILALLFLILLIPIAGVEAETLVIYAEETQKTAKEAYITEQVKTEDQFAEEILTSAITERLLESRISKRINTELQLAKEVDLTEFRYLYSEDGMTGLISGTLSYWVDIPLPFVKRQLRFTRQLVSRGFIGATDHTDPLGFDLMESVEASSTVYVFPRAGEKYHNQTCRLLHAQAVETFLTPGLKKEYQPCSICMAESLPLGTKVYVFPNTGEVYHRSTCPLVDRYVVPMELVDAIRDGYKPCSYCRGE